MNIFKAAIITIAILVGGSAYAQSEKGDMAVGGN